MISIWLFWDAVGSAAALVKVAGLRYQLHMYQLDGAESAARWLEQRERLLDDARAEQMDLCNERDLWRDWCVRAWREVSDLEERQQGTPCGLHSRKQPPGLVCAECVMITEIETKQMFADLLEWEAEISNLRQLAWNGWDKANVMEYCAYRFYHLWRTRSVGAATSSRTE